MAGYPTIDERDLSLLDPAFRRKVDRAVAALAAQGQEMLLYCAVRSPWTQAKLYRQSRTRRQVEAAIDRLEHAKAPFLAQCFRDVGAQNGPHVTNALPGQSWHQFGTALDGVPLRGGSTVWGTSAPEDLALWEAWRDACKAEGLTCGADWRMKDWPHVQDSPLSSPTREYDFDVIDRMMRNLFAA